METFARCQAVGRSGERSEHTVPLQVSQEAQPRSSAGTLTSPFLFTGTLLDPEGLYDEEVCTPDNLQKYEFLTFPHVLDCSIKSKFIACCLTFQMFRLRGILWSENKTNNQIFTQECLGKRIKGAGKEARSLSQVGSKKKKNQNKT